MFLSKLTFPWRMARQMAPYGGWPLFLQGAVNTIRFRMLHRLHGFDRWHISPIEWRPYAMELCGYVNHLIKAEGLRTVVEIGCGLGEILRRLQGVQVAGFDLDAAAIGVAQQRNPSAKFHVGSFADVRGRQIDLLIAVNFPHNIPPEELKGHLAGVLDGNRVRFVIVDKVRFKYFHDYDQILAGRGVKVWESPRFDNDRWVLCYRTVAGASG